MPANAPEPPARVAVARAADPQSSAVNGPARLEPAALAAFNGVAEVPRKYAAPPERLDQLLDDESSWDSI